MRTAINTLVIVSMTLFVMSCQDRQECREKIGRFTSQCIDCELDAEDLFRGKEDPVRTDQGDSGFVP